jgi:hypothetical protein
MSLTRRGAGRWSRKRWAVIALGLLVIVIIIVAASGGSSSNGWTTAERSQTLQECETAGTGTRACECAVKWLEGNLSPSQLLSATANGNYVAEGQAMIAACPGARGSGILGE